jgi:hypothetical protein
MWYEAIRIFLKPLGRPKRRGEDNININIQKEGFGGMERDRWRATVNVVIKLRVP